MTQRGKKTLLVTLTVILVLVVTAQTVKNNNAYTWLQPQLMYNHITRYTPDCDIRAYGATGNDASHDDGAAFAAGAAAGCVNFIAVPQQNASASTPTTYYIGTTVTVPLRLDCKNRDLVLIRDKASLGANRLFYLLGTAGTHLPFLSITNCGLQNGTATTSFTAGKDVVRTDYTDHVKLLHNKFVNCQGVYCDAEMRGTDFDVEDNIYQTWTMHGHFTGVESSNIHFRKNLGVNNPTCTSGCGGNTYFQANGSEQVADGAYFVVDMWVEDNVCNSNTIWECYDSHGGDGLHFARNRGYNSKFGIQIGLDTGGKVTTPVCQNITLDDNLMVQGTGTSGAQGIVVNGSDQSANGVCQWYRLTNNHVVGFGGTDGTGNIGAISLYATRNGTLIGNTSTSGKQTCLSLYYSNIDVLVDGFRCEDMDVANSGVPGQVAAFRTRADGNFGIRLSNVSLAASNSSFIPAWFYRQDTTWTNLQIDSYNTNVNPTTAVFSGSGMALNLSAAPGAGVFHASDCGYDTSGVCRWQLSTPVQGYSSPSSASVVTADGTTGNFFVDVNANGTGTSRGLPPGAQINIAGMGTAGGVLVTSVAKNDATNVTGGAGVGTRIFINNAVVTSATNQIISYQTSAFRDAFAIPSPFSATTITSTVATGTAPLTVTSTTPVANLVVAKHPQVLNCANTASCGNTAMTNGQVVIGTAQLTSGTPSTVTITGITPAFTSTTSYKCAITDETATINVLKYTRVSGSSFTVTGPNTITDIFSYVCAGN